MVQGSDEELKNLSKELDNIIKKKKKESSNKNAT